MYLFFLGYYGMYFSSSGDGDYFCVIFWLINEYFWKYGIYVCFGINFV